MVKRNQKINKWYLKKFLGEGGNGVVWLGRDSENNEVAIKILSKLSGKNKEKAYARFQAEVSILKKHGDISGVIPIIDAFLPEELGDDFPWYAMHVAQPISEYLIDKDIESTIHAVICIGETFVQLHDREICHRDIKPANLLVIEDEFYVCDFGLADFPEKLDLTKTDERIGAIWTIAPEMKRSGIKSNGTSADIYSLAKTLWILLTGIKDGFEGQYNPRSKNGLMKFKLKNPDEDKVVFFEEIPPIYTGPLDELLRLSTSDDPSERPSMKEFVEQLIFWSQAYKDFKIRNPLQWRDLHFRYFPNGVPETAVWKNIEVVVDVLNYLGSIDNLNHTFLPDGGGMDLLGAKIGNENNTIELLFGERSAHIVKPKRLIFESFGYDWEWNYFRLETDGLEPTGIEKPYENRESLVELEPMHYIEWHHWEYGEYLGKELPPSARMVFRFLKGDFVIFQKTSVYNRITSTYDGRHAQMSAEEFRAYIEGKIIIVQEIRNDIGVKKLLLENDEASMDDFVYGNLQKIFRDESMTRFRRQS